MTAVYLLRHVKTGLYYTGLAKPEWSEDPKKGYRPGSLAVAKGCTPYFASVIGPLEVVEFDVMTTFFEKGVVV